MAGRNKRRDHEDESGSAKAPPTSEPPCYDVFISYNSRDKAWVRGELLQRIEQAGLKAFIDYRDFTRGAPSIKEMERGVLTGTKTLLVLTPDYLESEWCDLEAIMAQTLSPANRDLRMIPLLKTECKKPLRMATLTHVDFTEGADLDLAWRQLLTALGAPPAQEPPKAPERDQWFLAHPYPMPPNFTGRIDERKMLSRWLDTDVARPLLVLRALGGFGKSALVWHWLLHDVAPGVWPRVVWWSFYEGDSSFDHFLAETLDYLSDGKTDPRALGPRQQLDEVIQLAYQSGILLVLDGFERELRAYGGLKAAYQGDEAAKGESNDRDCIYPLAEMFLRGVATLPDIRAKILLTTRLCPHVLEAKGGGLLQGCREEELKQMQPADAVEFFLARGIRGTHTEVETACAPYGYHPLSLRLLAGWIVNDFQQPGDIAAAKRIDIGGDLIARQHHILEQAYDSLMPMRKVLLGRIACFRTAVAYEALKALAETAEGSSKILDTDLRDLISRGLLHHDAKEGRFDLHPIVRRYAYDRLGAPDRAAAHARLRDYFAAVPKPDKGTRLEDLAPVIELYHHTVRAGEHDKAWNVYRYRLNRSLFMESCVYQTCVELLNDLLEHGLGSLPRLKKADDQGIVLNLLSAVHRYMGQPRQALEVYLPITENMELGSLVVNACRLGNVARCRIVLGKLCGAQEPLENAIAFCRRTIQKSAPGTAHTFVAKFWESASFSRLASLFAIRGRFDESEQYLTQAKNAFDDVEGQFYRWIATVHYALLRRDCVRALDAAQCAWGLKDKVGRTGSEINYRRERDEIRAEWMVGAALTAAWRHGRRREGSLLGEAESHLNKALECCRRINMVDYEADILIDLARLRAATGSAEEAQRLAEEALLITERSGYVLQGADAHLELAKLALARGDKATGLEHAQKAKELATCDGPPDYTYKAAYDEACALLEEQPPIINHRS